MVVCAPQPRLVSNTSSALELSGVRSVLFFLGPKSIGQSPHFPLFLLFLDFPHPLILSMLVCRQHVTQPSLRHHLTCRRRVLACIHGCDLSRHLMHGFFLEKIRFKLMILTQRSSRPLICFHWWLYRWEGNRLLTPHPQTVASYRNGFKVSAIDDECLATFPSYVIKGKTS